MCRPNSNEDRNTLLIDRAGDEHFNLVLLDSGGGLQKFDARADRGNIEAIRVRMDAALKAFSEGLAHAGKGGGVDRSLVDDIEKVGREFTRELLGAEADAFLAVIRRSARLQLNVTDPTIRIPWDFLVFDDAKSPKFLGSFVVITPQFYVNRRICRTADEFAPGPLGGRFQVGLVEDDTLDSACIDRQDPARADLEEIRTLVPLVRSVSAIKICGKLDRGQPRSSQIASFQKWLADERRVLHFNCHGNPPVGRNDYPDLRVSELFELKGADLTGAAAHNQNIAHGLVNLNVCKSAVGTYSPRKTLGQLFHDQNAEAVVCTTGVVADFFATIFARELYSRLGRCDLLTAMHETRTFLLDTLKHPMSLMYTFTGTGRFTPGSL